MAATMERDPCITSSPKTPEPMPKSEQGVSASPPSSSRRRKLELSPMLEECRRRRIRPVQLGLRFQPPSLIIQYTEVLSSGELSRRSVHRIPIDAAKLARSDIPLKQLADEMRNNCVHGVFLARVEEDQVENFLHRLRSGNLAQEVRQGSGTGGSPHQQQQQPQPPQKPRLLGQGRRAAAVGPLGRTKSRTPPGAEIQSAPCIPTSPRQRETLIAQQQDSAPQSHSHLRSSKTSPPLHHLQKTLGRSSISGQHSVKREEEERLLTPGSYMNQEAPVQQRMRDGTLRNTKKQDPHNLPTEKLRKPEAGPSRPHQEQQQTPRRLWKASPPTESVLATSQRLRGNTSASKQVSSTGHNGGSGSNANNNSHSKITKDDTAPILGNDPAMELEASPPTDRRCCACNVVSQTWSRAAATITPRALTMQEEKPGPGTGTARTTSLSQLSTTCDEEKAAPPSPQSSNADVNDILDTDIVDTSDVKMAMEVEEDKKEEKETEEKKTGNGDSCQAVEQGTWPCNMWIHWSTNASSSSSSSSSSSAIPTDPEEAFEAFRVSRGTDGISRSFAELLRASCSGEALEEMLKSEECCTPLDFVEHAVGKRRRLARALWERLADRRGLEQYERQSLAGHRAVVVGAGPVGLRCALELRLLGAEVVVLEQRAQFDRINRLHLWKWVGEDLKGWGAKIFEPPELSFGADPDFLHIGISELQMLLMKSALLLGVQLFFGTEFVGAERSVDGLHWNVRVKATTRSQGIPGPEMPAGLLRGVTFLLGADGPRGSVASATNLQVQRAGNLRKEAALGLVANFNNQQSMAEKRRRPFSLARQFYEELFAKCEKSTGIALENIVYYVCAQTHYFVMTPTRKSLVSCNIVPAEVAEDSRLQDNLDEAALADVAKAIVAFPWRLEDPALPSETLESPVGTAQLFDFSTTRRAVSGITVLDAASVVHAGPGSTSSSSAPSSTARLLVGLCGDALIEPFWPEGLGIVRGFFGALDLVSACKVFAETGDAEASIAHFEGAFSQLKSLAAKTRSAVLKPDDAAFGLDPTSRYRYANGNHQSMAKRAASAPASARAKARHCG
mmetsp:Transcript_22491/g.49283  ORF Transcript_22491/g.49283 Transcript_22491/m.49283 type:complete len:1072 (+) Transcript_22491:191-3406(+)